MVVWYGYKVNFQGYRLVKTRLR